MKNLLKDTGKKECGMKKIIKIFWKTYYRIRYPKMYKKTKDRDGFIY
jgi:hypothetical protein